VVVVAVLVVLKAMEHLDSSFAMVEVLVGDERAGWYYYSRRRRIYIESRHRQVDKAKRRRGHENKNPLSINAVDGC
jgi:hypothetical protein